MPKTPASSTVLDTQGLGEDLSAPLAKSSLAIPLQHLCRGSLFLYHPLHPSPPRLYPPICSFSQDWVEMFHP